MEIKDKTIALLIDSDNISQKYISTILEELNQYGNVTYRRLYGDFTKYSKDKSVKELKEILLEYSIEQVQQIAFTSGKNATDIRLVIDAMDILHSDKVDCFCIATSDSDFTSLAMRFRNDNITVIGAGEAKTPAPFRKACELFIAVDELMKASEEENAQSNKKPSTDNPYSKPNESDKKKELLIKTTKQIVNDNVETDGWMHFAAFLNELRKKENDFNPRLYGFPNSKPSQFFKGLKNKNGKTVFTLEKIDNVDKIRLN